MGEDQRLLDGLVVVVLGSWSSCGGRSVRVHAGTKVSLWLQLRDKVDGNPN